MSLRDYEKPNDNYEFDDGPCFSGFAFPCSVCKHARQHADMEPCRTCGHNINAVPLDDDRAAGVKRGCKEGGG